MAGMGFAEIGNTIRAERKARGLTQARLAEMARISRATLNSLERGTIRELGFLKLHTIMKILGYELAPARTGEKDGHQPEILRRMARRYIWWRSPAASVMDPCRVVAQVLDLGTLDDIQALAKELGKSALADALRQARPGWFRPKSWAFWHVALGLSAAGGAPAIPRRNRNGLPRPA